MYNHAPLAAQTPATLFCNGKSTMNVKYYPIMGRGERGAKFQLARFEDENGEMYKGQYDQEHHFGSEEEVKEHIAGVMKMDPADITLVRWDL
ncbi:MAG: hypothetical protein AAGF46_03360 [Pseudomonadota bacterium]